MMSLPLSEVATGICNASASATSSACAPEARAPPPTTKIGRSACCSRLERGVDILRLGLRPEGRHARKLVLDDAVQLALFGIELAFVAAELQMHRPRSAGGRDAEGLPQHVRRAGDVVDGRIEFGHRLERRHIVDFLVDLPEFCFRVTPAGDRDDWRVRQIRVAQARREIERADHLRHADAGLARRARVAVRHIRCRFLAMAMDACDRGAPLHLGKGPPQHRRHHEHMRDAVAGEHVGDDFGAEAFDVVAELHRLDVLVKGA